MSEKPENRTGSPATHIYDLTWDWDRTNITEHGDHAGYDVCIPCKSETDTKAFYVEGVRFADGKCSLRVYNRDLALLAYRFNDGPAKDFLRMIEEFLALHAGIEALEERAGYRNRDTGH